MKYNWIAQEVDRARHFLAPRVLSACISSTYAVLHERTVPCLTILFPGNMNGQGMCPPAVLQQVQLSRGSHTSAASSGCTELISVYTQSVQNIFDFLVMPAKRRYSYTSLRGRAQDGSTKKGRGRRKSLKKFGGLHEKSPFVMPFSTVVRLQAPRSWMRIISSEAWRPQ